MADETQNFMKTSAPARDGVNAADIEGALRSVVDSETLAGSPRLQEFLNYVVAETLAGRSGRIRAKTIALDVYDRSPGETEGSDTVVRVEARRLRRLLDDYYAGEGKDDPVRLHIDSGGYVPRFERLSQPFTVAEDSEISTGTVPNRRIAAMGIAAAIVVGGGLLVAWRGSETPVPAEVASTLERAERRAIMDQSPAALEAANIVEQARGLMYPAFDLRRQLLTAELFRTAASMDENSAQAYAGVAMTLATAALLMLEGEQHDAYLLEANQMLDRALDLDTSDPWVQSAAGWLRFVERDYGAAVDYVSRSLELAPTDGNILDTYGAVMLFSGNFEEAARVSHPDLARVGPSPRFAFGNVHGGANIHLGNYAAAVRSIEENNESGGPVSPPGVVLLAVAYHGMGRMDEARQLVRVLEEDWPNFDVARVFLRLHKDEDHAAEIVDRLKELGWRSESQG